MRSVVVLCLLLAGCSSQWARSECEKPYVAAQFTTTDACMYIKEREWNEQFASGIAGVPAAYDAGRQQAQVQRPVSCKTKQRWDGTLETTCY